MSLHTRMLLGFIAGTTLGLMANLFAADAGWLDAFVGYVADPVGQLFLRLLFMLVIPLVFSALVLGVVEIGDPRSLGRIGTKTLLWILVVTTVAVGIGLLMVNLLEPGRGIPPELGAELMSQTGDRAAQIAAGRENVSGMAVLLNIVPRNPVQAAANGDLIAVMFFALMFGVAATVVRSEGTRTFVSAMQGVYDICL
ncbi:dicarboxylate/amino acid:cation symporter, partial [Arenimonas caeni]|uniref:dicarboxylate/amino acid:cation symporter n=1 Tax=Arenimonas caeni TaxID=2058085 RepID=UPI002A3693C2